MDSGPAENVPPEPNAKRDALYSIAHRGFAGVAPENTLAAIRGASRGIPPGSSGGAGAAGGVGGGPDAASDGAAADMVEVDVLPAAGGEPVVFHDLTLGRLTDVSDDRRRQAVWETPVETLRELSILGSDESVPTLAAVMDAMPPAVGVNVELKHPGTGQPHRELGRKERARGRERWVGFVERVVSILDGHDNAALASSSYEGALAALREVAPDLPLAYLFWNGIEAGLDITRRYDCEAVHPAMDMIRGTDLFNAGYIPTGPFAEIDLVERAHDAGRAVNVWTVENWHQAAQLRGVDVDGLIADYPGLSGLTTADRLNAESEPAADHPTGGDASPTASDD